MTRLGAAVVLAVDGAAGAGVGAAVAAGGAGAVTVGVELGTVPVGSAAVHSFTPPWRVQAPRRRCSTAPIRMPLPGAGWRSGRS